MTRPFALDRLGLHIKQQGDFAIDAFEFKRLAVRRCFKEFIGNVAIILALWPALIMCRRVNSSLWMSLRVGLAGGCAAIACYWTFQRVAEVYSTLA